MFHFFAPDSQHRSDGVLDPVSRSSDDQTCDGRLAEDAGHAGDRRQARSPTSRRSIVFALEGTMHHIVNKLIERMIFDNETNAKIIVTFSFKS